MDSNSLNRVFTNKQQNITIVFVGLILFIGLFALITIIYCFAYLKLNLFSSRIDQFFLQLVAKDWLYILTAALCSLILISFGYAYLLWLNSKKGVSDEGEYPKHDRQTNQTFARQQDSGQTQFAINNIKIVEQIKSHLINHYGRFWRRQVKIYCVIGQQEEIHHQLPNLIQEGWQESNGVLLIWGGEPLVSLEQGTKSILNKLHHKSFDAVVWFSSVELLKQPHFVNKVATHLFERELILKRRAPLYTVALYNQDKTFHETTGKTVGVLLPKQASSELMLAQLNSLIFQLTTQSMRVAPYRTSLINQSTIDVLPTLSSTNFQKNSEIQPDGWLGIANLLAMGDAEALSHAFSSIFKHKSRVYFRGLLFKVSRKESDFILTHTGLPAQLEVNIAQGSYQQSWMPDATWEGILETTQDDASPLAVDWVYAGQLSFILFLLGFGLGTGTSYVLNRQAIASIEARIETLVAGGNLTEDKRYATLALQQDIERLEHQLTAGLPFFYRFGLNQHQTILNRLWAQYEYSVLPSLQEGILESLFEVLRTWLVLPPNSTERLTQQQASYDALKAYLMLINPIKADTNFLHHYLTNLSTKRPNPRINALSLQNSDDKLLRFFADHLRKNPTWAVEQDVDLVASIRAVLLSQIRMSSNETTLYQTILHNTSNIYGELTLNQMVGDTDYEALFTLQKQDGESMSIPGMFTRQAYEKQVKKAIEQVVDSRQEQIDWVLSDNPTNLQFTDIQQEDTPEALSARLTERYFNDYSNVWLQFLNRLCWKNASNLLESIDQLTLLADSRQSPLIALFNTISFHSQVNAKTSEFIDSHLRFIPNAFITEDNNSNIGSEELANRQNAISQQNISQKILAATFAPLLNLISTANQSEHNQFSLQAYLTRITKLRLKLQQVANAPNPDLIMRTLVQTIFQGTSVELSDIHDYGQLIAESLGTQWREFGETLFVQPFEQAWEQLLIPASESLNRQWQQTIVDEWQRAFQGRFPFTNGTNDASLPLLGQFIRPDLGRIDQFLSRQLAGVIQKEGNRWVPNTLNVQGIVDPDFFDAINKLADIAQIMYLTGDASIQFELLARPRKGVTATQLLLDGQLLRYFNQVEKWQRLIWPGNLLTTGTRLNWSREKGGIQIYAEHSGSWGFIRLLQQAKVKPLDNSTYQLSFNQKNGPSLVYILRTSVGAGPLALLSLQDFKLPQHIFVTSSPSSRSVLDLSDNDIDPEQNLTPYTYDDIPQAWQDNAIDIENEDANDIVENPDDSKNLESSEQLKNIKNIENIEQMEKMDSIDSTNRLDDKSHVIEFNSEQSLIEEVLQTEVEQIIKNSSNGLDKRSSNRIRNKLFTGFTQQ